MKNYAGKDGDTGKECRWNPEHCEGCFQNIPCSEGYYLSDEKGCTKCGCDTQGRRDPKFDICKDDGIGISEYILQLSHLNLIKNFRKN